MGKHWNIDVKDVYMSFGQANSGSRHLRQRNAGNDGEMEAPSADAPTPHSIMEAGNFILGWIQEKGLLVSINHSERYSKSNNESHD